MSQIVPYFVGNGVKNCNQGIQGQDVNVVLACLCWEPKLPTLDGLLDAQNWHQRHNQAE